MASSLSKDESIIEAKPSEKYENDRKEFQELIDEGFDLYATDGIVDLTHTIKTERRVNAGKQIPVFTPLIQQQNEYGTCTK